MTTPTFNLADLWETLAAAGPDAECLVAGDVRHTRRSLDEAANRVGRFLQSRAVRPGDHVGIYARNRAEYVEALLGCWKCGAVPVNVNWRYVADELRYVFDDAELVAVIAERQYAPLLAELAPEFPQIHTYVLLDDESNDPVSFDAATWDDAVGAQPATATRDFDDVPRSSDDVYMLYTGGTTGMPKGVMWRHEDFFYACVLGGNPLAPISKPAEIANNVTPGFQMSSLVLGPLMHGGGQWLTLIGLYSGNRPVVYCEPSFDAAKVLDLAVREKCTGIGIIGDAMSRPLAEAVLAEPNRWDLSSILSLGNGGAMLSAAVKEQLARAFPHAMLTDSYGASETGAAGTEAGASATHDRPAFTVDARTSVLDPDTLEPVEPGSEVQGLFARRGYIPLGYWKDEAKTAATFRTDAHGVRWVVPGDWATIDGEGRIVLFGRGSGCINSGGEKIFPEEVEASIRAHPDVFDAVVVGVADERWGQRVVALVQLRAGAPALTLEELQAHCRTKIAGYKVPRELLLGEAPRTNTNKPDYATAQKIAAARLA